MHIATASNHLRASTMFQLVTVIVACAAIASGFDVGVTRRGPVDYLSSAGLRSGFSRDVVRSSSLIDVEPVRRQVVEVEQVRQPVYEVERRPSVVNVEQVRQPVYEVERRPSVVNVEQVRQPVYEVERRPSVVSVEHVRQPVYEVDRRPSVVNVEQFRRRPSIEVVEEVRRPSVVEVEQVRRPYLRPNVEVEQYSRPVVEFEQVRRQAPTWQVVDDVRRPSVVQVEQVRRPSVVQVEQVRRPSVTSVVEVEQVRRPVVEQVRPRPARVVELVLSEPDVEIVAPAPPYSTAIQSAEEHINYILGKLNFVIPSPEQQGFVALILSLQAAAEGVAQGLDYDSAYAAEVRIFELAWQSPEAARDLITPIYKRADEKVNPMRRLVGDVCNISNEGSSWCDEQIEQAVRNNPEYQGYADLVIEIWKLSTLFEQHQAEWLRVIEEHREEEYLAEARYSLKNLVLQTARTFNVLNSVY